MKYIKQHVQLLLSITVIAGVTAVGYHALNHSFAETPPATSAEQATYNSGNQSLPSVTATPVDSFIDSEGVNIHSSYNTTPYDEDTGTTIDGKNIDNALNTLDIHNVRDNPSPTAASTEIGNLQYLANNGIKFDFIIDAAQAVAYLNDPADNPNSIQNEINEINSKGLAADTIAIENANELDYSSNPGYSTNWAANDYSLEQSIISDGNGKFPLLAPSLSGSEDLTDSTALAGTGVGGLVNYGNIHSYPKGGTTPEAVPALTNHITAGQNVAGSKPIWSTETGYNDYTAGTQPIPVSQSDQAVLDPRIYLSDYMHGIAKSFMYELLDTNNSRQAFQDHWGLFNNDWSPKPSATAIANMNSALTGLTGGDAGAPSVSSLNYQITGGDSSLDQLLLGKHTASGDHYDLVVWESTLPSSASTNVTISFSSNMNVAKYTPSSSASAVATYSSVSSISNATSGPAITIYDITAAPPPPPPPPPKCPTGETGTPPNCISGSKTTTSGGSNGASGSSGSTNTNQGTASHPATLKTIGSASSPVTASAITLTPSISIPLNEVTKVNYYIDGKLVATKTKAPFSYKLTSADFKNGCHTVKTVVYVKTSIYSSSQRQICATLTTKKNVKDTEWGLLAVCIIVIALVLAEFHPFYPKNSHLVSRTVLKVWKKIRRKPKGPIDSRKPTSKEPPPHNINSSDQSIDAPTVIAPKDPNADGEGN